LHQLIQRNVNRLLNLVNELLEFRKAEAGMMKIKASEIGLSAFLNDISSEFDEVATEKKFISSKISILQPNYGLTKVFWVK
jgi:signal transduction histidine kinase